MEDCSGAVVMTQRRWVEKVLECENDHTSVENWFRSDYAQFKSPINLYHCDWNQLITDSNCNCWSYRTSFSSVGLSVLFQF